MSKKGLKEIVIESDQIPGQTNCFDQLFKKAYEEPHVTIDEWSYAGASTEEEWLAWKVEYKKG